MKRLNEREKELVCIAIDEVLDLKEYQKKGSYSVLGDELKAIKEKLKYEETASGNQLIRGFSWAGCNGTEYDLREKVMLRGFQTLYHDAHYNWALVNFKDMQIYSYCEGDTSLIKCKNFKKFIAEMKAHIKWMKEQDMEGDLIDLQDDLRKLKNQNYAELIREVKA